MCMRQLDLFKKKAKPKTVKITTLKGIETTLEIEETSRYVWQNHKSL